MVRLQIALDPIEADNLARLAAKELRDPRDQLRLILRQELERRGLLAEVKSAGAGPEGGGQWPRVRHPPPT